MAKNPVDFNVYPDFSLAYLMDTKLRSFKKVAHGNVKLTAMIAEMEPIVLALQKKLTPKDEMKLGEMGVNINNVEYFVAVSSAGIVEEIRSKDNIIISLSADIVDSIVMDIQRQLRDAADQRQTEEEHSARRLG